MNELNHSIPNVSDNCRDFISKLLSFNPDDRPTAAEAMEHPFITEADYAVILQQTQHLTPQKHLRNFRSDSLMKKAVGDIIACQDMCKS